MMNPRKKARVMQQLAKQVADKLPGQLITLLVFDTNNLSADYISNAGRETMIQALRETADRLEANQDITPEMMEAQDVRH